MTQFTAFQERSHKNTNLVKFYLVLITLFLSNRGGHDHH